MTTTSVDFRELGRKQYVRATTLPKWRRLAIRNAQNRSIFYNKLSIALMRVEDAAPPERVQCPVCTAWEKRGETCADNELRRQRER